MTISCTIKGKFFRRKGELHDYLQTLVASYADGEIVNAGDSDFLMEVLKYHKDYAAKTSKAIKNIKADKSRYYSGPKTRCFYLLYADGTNDDFSYIECLKGIK